MEDGEDRDQREDSEERDQREDSEDRDLELDNILAEDAFRELGETPEVH
jgi:hypothetical protein